MSIGHITCLRFRPVPAYGLKPVAAGFEWFAVGMFLDADPAPV